MTKEILILLGCVPLYVVNSFCDKMASLKKENAYNRIYNCIKFFLCGICMLPAFFRDDGTRLGIGCLVCGALCGAMYALSKTVILKGYERTSVAFMTLCHSSGMLLPCILGHFFWSEKLSIVSVLGMMLAILSIVLLKHGKEEKERVDTKGALLGIIVFLSSAGVMVTQKLMALYFVRESVGAYNLYSFFVAFLIICFSFISKKRNVTVIEKKDKRAVFLYALGSAFSLSVISFVMTSLAGKVPSIILFPLFNGLGIIFVCIFSAFAFKERLTWLKTLGLGIGVLGLCLVNF